MWSFRRHHIGLFLLAAFVSLSIGASALLDLHRPGSLQEVLLSADENLPKLVGVSLKSATETPDCPISSFNNLGNLHHPISTQSDLTQRYFDQGLTLVYGFNHPEAIRSFREAARLDSTCAMCYWGIALALGPNINADMGNDAVVKAWQALQTAIALSTYATSKEQSYIQALAKRYTQTDQGKRESLDWEYANAMRQVAHRYPDDPDAATLFAEALMNTMPWDYWRSQKPKPATTEAISALESALQLNPHHPGALHFYIHIIEGSPDFKAGLPAAELLTSLVPGSAHLLHMPSHLYFKQGDYHRAVIANQTAIETDRAYLSKCHPKDGYIQSYAFHNYKFLWASALFSGESQIALQAAQSITSPKNQWHVSVNSGQHYYAMPLYTLSRFGKWDEILSQPQPSQDLKYLSGVWHFARGNAFLAKGQVQKTKQELQQLQAIATAPDTQNLIIERNPAALLLKLALTILRGKVEANQGHHIAAIRELEKAMSMETKLKNTELRAWYPPVRQTLGRVLLESKRPAEAEAVYRQDLEQNPENGWALYGLAQSLHDQAKTVEAREIQSRFEKAWQYADTGLPNF